MHYATAVTHKVMTLIIISGVKGLG